MSKTLLQATNEILKKVKVIAGDAGELTTLTDSGRQVYIDNVIQALNETIDQLYSVSNKPQPNELGEATINLVANDRDYTLKANLIQLRWPLVDETNGRVIEEYPGGYIELVNSQLIPSNHTGIPYYGAIRPTDGKLYLDSLPTSDETGLVYKYRFDKDTGMNSASDTVPFNDAVFRAMVPAVAEIWKRNQQQSFDPEMYQMSLGRASRLLTNVQGKNSWVSFRAVRSEGPYDN